MRRARLALLLALLLGAAPAHAAPLDLAGAWYVLVHYKDSASNNPDFERWLDRIWVFERSGSRLKWSRYPIVVFDDESGRFERTSAKYGRVMHFWEPNSGQLSQIQSGLAVNPRGSKTKSLRGSDVEGWRSRGAIGAFSANTLTYTEIWSATDLGGLPVFTFEESLGGSRAESLDGITEFRSVEVTPEGELRGTYNRDGTRTGTFRMMRTGAVGEVTKSQSQAEVRRRAAAALAGAAAAEGLAEMLADPDLSESDLVRIYKGRVLAAGGDPEDRDAQIRSLVDAIMAERRKGTSPQEIESKVRNGTISR